MANAQPDHLSDLYLLIHDLFLSLLSLLPLPLYTFLIIGMLGAGLTQKDIGISLGFGIAAFTMLHVYAVCMLYNFWNSGKLTLPYSWTLLYSDVIIGMAVIGFVVLAAIWKVLRNFLLTILPMREESEAERKQSEGKRDADITSKKAE